MKSQDLISIIQPAYNAGKYIDAAINSVVCQTYPFWELIIINDGSTDDTEVIVRSFDDPRIRYVRKERGGVSSARNRGLHLMSGDYFCFLDADDILPPKSLEIRLAMFSEDPTLEFVDGFVRVLDQPMETTLHIFKPRQRGSPLRSLLQLTGNCFFGPTWMIKRKSMEYHLDEGLTHGEDYFFYLTLSRSGGYYDYVEEEILHYRKHPESAMHNIKGLQMGYQRIYSHLRRWPEFVLMYRLVYLFRMKKIVFLSFLSIKRYRSAVNALFS